MHCMPNITMLYFSVLCPSHLVEGEEEGSNLPVPDIVGTGLRHYSWALCFWELLITENVVC